MNKIKLNKKKAFIGTVIIAVLASAAIGSISPSLSYFDINTVLNRFILAVPLMYIYFKSVMMWLNKCEVPEVQNE